MSSVSDIGQLISRSPEVRGGRPCIAGTGISVHRIVGWYKLGLTPEQIVDRIGNLSLAQVYAALAYYHGNQEEIESEIAAERTEAERLEREHANPTCRRGAEASRKGAKAQRKKEEWLILSSSLRLRAFA